MLVRLTAFIACLFYLLSTTHAGAEDPVAEARTVISNQIAALTRGDADTAYSYASPDIRSLFSDKNAFMAMVRKNYGPVSSTNGYAFGAAKMIGGGEVVLQEVMVSATEGQGWLAIYEMRLMDDGSYKVNGVSMIRNSISQGI